MALRQQILDESILLFKRLGIRGVTMDMIAENIGISKRTLYENFQNKDELVEECVKVLIDKRNNDANEIIRNSTHFLETFMLFMWHHINELKSVNPLFMRDIRKLYPQSACKQANDFSDQIKSKMKDFVTKGINEGVFRSEINPEIAAILIYEQIGLLHNESGREVFPASKFSSAEVFEHIAINYIRGMSTLKGLELIDYYYNKYKRK